MKQDELLTITEAAKYAGVDRSTIYRWIGDGVRYQRRLYYLTAEIRKGHTRIRMTTFDKFLDQVGYEAEVDDADQP